MSAIIWFVIGVAIGAAIPDTIRALGRRIRHKAIDLKRQVDQDLKSTDKRQD